MKQFADLFTRLDQTNKTNQKVEAIKSYFEVAPDKDKLWTLALFTHKRPKKQVRTSLLRQWVGEIAGIPDWLVEESYHIVGDLGETITLLLPLSEQQQDEPLSYWITYLQQLENLNDDEKKIKILQAWAKMTQPEQFVFTKLMTGSFRVGVSQNLVIRAIADVFQLDPTIVAHRVMGDWHPDKTEFHHLILEENKEDRLSRPYPFFLAHAIDSETVPTLGPADAWQAEWKWDGIRAQLIYRQGKLYVWSRGEELVTEKFPEFQTFADILPEGTVLDGEILPFSNGQILPFGTLQTRIGRKNLTKNVLKNAPIVLMAYDLLEWEGNDIRSWPLIERRKQLEELHQQFHSFLPAFQMSSVVETDEWNILKKLQTQARTFSAEGFMLKRKSSPYLVGRKRGDWWKWKVDPLTIDGVLINAQRGTGRRAGLYTDYTFAVWQQTPGKKELVPFTKAYSGLTDAEIRQVDHFVKRNTRERFGPVRTVKPELVFEIAFEGIQFSKRHKSGVALRFPRILRWRHDKTAEEANSLEDLQELLTLYGNA